MAKSQKGKSKKKFKKESKNGTKNGNRLPKWIPLTIGGLILLVVSNLVIGLGSYLLTRRKYRDAECKERNQEIDCESDSNDDNQDLEETQYPSEEDVKAKVTKYINNELLGGQSNAEIKNFKLDPENENLYIFEVVLDGQSFESYASIDGKYIFTERLDMTESQDTPDSNPDEEQPTPDTDSDSYPKSDIPEVLLFTMSYCPYGNQAEDFVQPVYDLLKNDINFEPHYVIYSEDYGYEGSDYCLDSENRYCSMHGIQELNQGVRELCTYKYQKDKFWDFVAQANSDCDYNNVDTCWETVASKVGLNSSQISTCETNEAVELLKNEVTLNEKYNVTGSPTILINGKNYSGSRTPEDFKKAICSSFENKPAACDTTLESSSPEVSGSCN